MALQLFEPFYEPFHHTPAPRLTQEMALMARELGKVETTDDGGFRFKCQLDGYRPADVHVHHEGDQLIIEAQHSKKGRHGHFERKTRRAVRLPEGLDHQNVRCELDEHGQMTVTVPKVAPAVDTKRRIPVTFKHSGNQ